MIPTQSKFSRATGSPFDRFFSKVDASGICWEWTASKNTKGYGAWTWGHGANKKTMSAHRYAWINLVGEIPDGLEIDHFCRVRHCVNPDHLELVTRSENMLRAKGTGVANRRKTHCPRGHEYTEGNTYLQYETRKGRPYVGRSCLTCRHAYRRT